MEYSAVLFIMQNKIGCSLLKHKHKMFMISCGMFFISCLQYVCCFGYFLCRLFVIYVVAARVYFADDDIDCTIVVLEYLCWMVTFVICPQYDGCGIFWLLSLLRKRLGTMVDHLLYPGDGTCFLFLFSYSKNKHINKQKT